MVTLFEYIKVGKFLLLQIKQALKIYDENERTKNLSGMLDLTRQFLVLFSEVSANDETSREGLQEVLRKESFKISAP